MKGSIAQAIETAQSTPLVPGTGLLTYPVPYGSADAGDVKQTWNRDSPAEVEAARKMFNDLTSKGYRGFRVDDNGEAAAQMLSFDPEAERITLIPGLRGG